MKVGDKHTASTTVSDTLTAEHMGSGDMPVLATPAMIALMEQAAKDLIASSLDEGNTSVGIKMDVSHDKASPVGAAITATAEITEIDGRRIAFNVIAHQGDTIIGQGRHERFIVNRERFLQKIY